jgi:hypothetical protein
MPIQTIYRYLFILLLSPSFGCGEQTTEREIPETQSAKEDTCYSIINGNKTSDFKAINMIAYAKGGGLFTCTGTFISDNTMVTAAHCVPENANETLTFIPGNTIDLGDTYDSIQENLDSGVEALLFIRGDIQTVGDDQIGTDESPKDLAIAIFPDNTAPAIMPLRQTNIEGGESIDLVGFGDTAIVDNSDGRVRHKRHGKNNVVENADLRAALPNLWIVAGRDSTSTTDGSASDSLAAQGDSGGPLIFENTIVGIASAAGEVPAGSFSEIISESAMNIYASVHSSFAKTLFETAKSEGARFEISNNSSDVDQPSTDDSTSSDENIADQQSDCSQ